MSAKGRPERELRPLGGWGADPAGAKGVLEARRGG